MYKTGLVVGKFAPLHRGHELVINTAISQCDRVVILSYTSLPDAPSAAHRRVWLTTLFPTAITIVLEEGFPNDEADGEIHRVFCRDLLNKLDLSPDAVFGSDDYIPGFAEILHATPVVVDSHRSIFPVSGTMLRTGKASMHNWCSTIVNTYYAKRILLIGGESSGKSTLAAALIKAMPSWGKVDEYGRTFGEQTSNVYGFQDMLYIAKTQVYDEESYMLYFANSVIVCDTSPLVTKFYSQKWYEDVDPMLDILAQRTYDYVFFCRRDFPYAYEEGRSGPKFAQEQSNYYEENISQPFINLSGTIEQRVQIVLEEINK